MVFCCKLSKNKMVKRLTWSHRTSNGQNDYGDYGAFLFLAVFSHKAWANIGIKIE